MDAAANSLIWNPSPRLRWPVVALVTGLHVAVGYGVWQGQAQVPGLTESAPLFVSLISPAESQPSAQVLPVQPKPVSQVQRPSPSRPIVAEAPVAAPAEFAVPVPEPAPVVEVQPPVAEVASRPRSQPVSLPELAAVCAERVPPVYPWRAKKMGLQGRVVLQVALDDAGRITQAAVHQSSGVTLLDEAALAAVRQWRCQPAMSHGHAVAAVALQPFKFNLAEK